MLPWLYTGVLFVTGLAIGSFLNVVVYRVPLGLSIISPPSACPACGTRIRARDNIPLFGWLFLGGRCRACRQPISVRYPLVELATGLLWAGVGWRLAGLERGFAADVFTGLLELAFVSAMVVTFLIDWDHRIILDEISLGGTGVAFVTSLLLPELHHAATGAAFADHHPFLDSVLGDTAAWARSGAASLVGAGVGLGFSLLIAGVGNLAFRRAIAEARRHDPDVDTALGLGDVKLMTFFGAFLGWKSVLFVFIAASLVGAVFGSIMKYRSGDAGGETGWKGVVRRWRSGDSVLPFGPFLVTGALLYLFFGTGLMAAARELATPGG